MSDYKKLAKILRKGSPGEGSKGGNVIGHTRSGHPIYASANHEGHQNFKAQDHTDAMNAHHEVWSKTQSKIQNIRAKKPNWNPPKEVHDFLNHHYTQMQRHQGRANAAMDREKRHAKIMAEPSGHIKGPYPYHTPQNIHKGLNDIEVPLMAAVVIISPDKKKVLLGKRNKDKEWESPAGHADVGEHPEDVVIRECFEEFNIPLKPDQLEQLPMMYKKDMTPVHCYMAVVKPYQIKNISCEDDPSEEHSKWKWFKLDEKLPDEMEDNRFNMIVHAKMKLAGILEMNKSYQTMDDLEGMTTFNTADHATESSEGAKEQELITRHMADYQPGDVPKVIPLDGSELYLVKIDDGLYSGFVKRVDQEGLQETVANIDKMTIPALVQFLRAKQVIKEVSKSPEPPKEDKLQALLRELLPKEDRLIYVSMDGDNIGNKVAQAEARDDEAALMEFSRRINAGQNVFETWAHSVGGSIIEGGGDEALAKVPESAKSKVEFFRNQYEQVVGSTVTVGVGETISQATKARELGKLKGKNRTEVFIPMKSDEELKELYKPKDAAEKLKDSGVLALIKALMRKSAPHPIGTVRQWGVNKYAKHNDGWVVIGGEHNGKLMGCFLDKPTHEDFARFCSHTSIKEDEKVKKSHTLTEKLEEFAKAQNLPTGSVRLWSGQKFIKQGDGHWMPMGNSDNEPPKPNVQTSHPSPTQEPQSAIIHNDANSMAIARPRDEALPKGATSGDLADDHIGKQPPIPEPKGPLSHLRAEKNAGGHVSIHSKDLHLALKHGPTSIISAGRNHNDPVDKGMTDEQINKRHKKLEEELKDRGHKFTKVKGKHGGSSDAFMVHNADPKEMDELGSKFNQESVLHTKAGENRFHYLSGEHKGTHHKGSGHVEVPDAKDYYHEINTTDGKKAKFSLNMDYGKHHKNE